MLYCDHLLELQLDHWPIQDTPTTTWCVAPVFPLLSTIYIYIYIYSYLVNIKWKHFYTISGSHFCICTQSLNAAVVFFCDNVRFSSHSSSTREHCLCQRLEPEVQEGHFTSKIKMKQRHGSSHCAKNCTGQEEKMAGAKNRSAEQLNALTCPKQ